MNDDSPQPLPIDGVLDLHTFRPEDIGELVPEYLAECRALGILQVRVIHGKGIGNLQRGVHALLSRLPEVISFCEASVPFGGRVEVETDPVNDGTGKFERRVMLGEWGAQLAPIWFCIGTSADAPQ